MEYIADALRDLVFSLLPFSSLELKGMFIDVGLLHIWDFLRDYLFNYKIWIRGFLPCLFLWRLLPGSRRSRRPFFYDGLIYPPAEIILIFPFLNIFITE